MTPRSRQANAAGPDGAGQRPRPRRVLPPARSAGSCRKPVTLADADTNPLDTGPSDTGPSDTGLSDTGLAGTDLHVARRAGGRPEPFLQPPGRT